MPSAYPWGTLEPLSRNVVRVASDARQRLRATARQASGVLSELLELPTEVVVQRSLLGRLPMAPDAIWLSHGELKLGVLVEPALAAFLAARVLRRTETLTDPREPLSPALAGLIAALASETARRFGVVTGLLGGPPAAEEALIVELTFVLEGRPFLLTTYVVGALASHTPEPTLKQLGDLTLRLPLVIASVVVERHELLTLEVGGALLPAAGTTVDGLGVGRGILVGPESERGIVVELRPEGELVVGEIAEARLSVEPENPSPSEGETLTDVLLDTPVVVRIELGAVSMSARQWARLGPGDVIETAQRIGEPVVLRVAGRELGRGELVNVDGQVGVRIKKLYEGS